jgi:transcriptional regulator with GAF, ATPase, and Fis domain
MTSDRMSRLFGRYDVEREIGRGGTGRVHLARDAAARGRRVALKVLDPAVAGDAAARETLRNEFRALASLRHPGLARVFDYGVDEASGAVFLVEEFVRGEDLLRAAPKLSTAALRSLFVQAARALDSIHRRGLVHFDVKPENLLVIAGRRKASVKLVDFGIAGVRRASSCGDTFAGTRGYVAPERWRGDAIDGRADLWALGVAFFRALTGRFPDESNGEAAPPWLRSVLPRLLDPEPSRRFASGRELVEALNRASAGRFRVETRGERLESIRSGPFVGRRATIRGLVRRAESIVGGRARPALIVLRGPSGSGRTRLLEEFRVACRLRHLPVIGDAPRDGASRAFPILGAWVRELASSAGGKAHPSLPALRAIAPDTFGRPRATDRADLAAERGDFRDAVVAWLRDALRGRGSVLLADDLDAADARTIEVVTLLVRLADAAGSPIAVVATLGGARDGARADAAIRALRQSGLASEIRLAPLRVDDVARWLAGQAGDAAARRRAALHRLARALVARTNGNPAELEETLRFVLDERSCDLVSLLEAATRDADLAVPSALRAGWRERVAALDAAERRVLLALALARRAMPAEAIGADASAAAARLEARTLVERTAAGWSLQSAALREAVLESATPDETRPIHAAIASTLPSRGAGLEVELELARHALGAAIGGGERAARRAAAQALRAARECRLRDAPGDGEPVLRALLDAEVAIPERTRDRARILSGDLLAAQGEHERALDAYRAAERAGGLALARLDRRIGEASRECGDYAEARARLERAIASPALEPGSTEHARAILALGMTWLLLGDPATGRLVARQALDAAGASRRAPLADAHLWNLLGMTAFRCGDVREAEAAYARALRRFESRDAGAAAAGVLNNLAVLRTQQGRFTEAKRLHARALAVFERRGNLAQEAMTRNNLALAEIARGDLASARAGLEQSRAVRRALGDAYGEASSLGNLGVCLREEGRLAEARDALREARRRFAALGNRREEALLLAHTAHLEVDLGRPSEAATLARRALERLEADAFPRERSVALVAAARAALERGDSAAARERLQEAIPLAGEASSRPWAARATVLLADDAIRRGDAPAARAALSAARGLISGTDLADVRARLATSRAELARLEGRRLSKAEVERAAKLGRLSERAEVRLRALAALGEAFFEDGDADGAARALGEALAVVDSSARGLAAADARRVRARPAHARIARLLALARRLAAAGGGSPGRRFAALVEVNRRLLAERDPDALLGVILDAAIELSGAERGFVILRSATGLGFPVARNFEKRDLARASDHVSRAFVQRVLETGRTWVGDDTAGDDRLRRSKSLLDLRAASLVAVPLRAAGGDGATLGALYLDHRREAGLFAGESRALLEAFADQAALALEIRRRERAIEELERRLEAGLEERTRELRRARTRGSRSGAESAPPMSDAMRAIASVVERVAPTDLTIALSGESGTGKDWLARGIHAQSRRAAKPFVTLDCATLPEPLVEAELFGHRRGAFTGAGHDRKGVFESASGGTLYLDGVDSLSPAAQAKILRVIEAREVRPIGAATPVRVNVRLIVSSTRPLEEEVARGRFREDLHFRLKEVVVRLPALRERREDVPALVEEFLAEAIAEGPRRRRAVRFSKEAMARLLDYPWPGNVRELRNEVRRAVLLGEDEIRTASLSPDVRAGGGPVANGGHLTAEGFREALREAEAALVRRALQAAKGNQSRAAKLLGLSRFGLRKKMSRLGIAPPEPDRG